MFVFVHLIFAFECVPAVTMNVIFATVLMFSLTPNNVMALSFRVAKEHGKRYQAK